MLFSLKNSVQACSTPSQPTTLCPNPCKWTKSLLLPHRGTKISRHTFSPDFSQPINSSILSSNFGFTSGRWNETSPFCHWLSQIEILSVLILNSLANLFYQTEQPQFISVKFKNKSILKIQSHKLSLLNISWGTYPITSSMEELSAITLQPLMMNELKIRWLWKL